MEKMSRGANCEGVTSRNERVVGGIIEYKGDCSMQDHVHRQMDIGQR